MLCDAVLLLLLQMPFDLFNYLLRQRIIFLAGYVNDKVPRVLVRVARCCGLPHVSSQSMCRAVVAHCNMRQCRKSNQDNSPHVQHTICVYAHPTSNDFHLLCRLLPRLWVPLLALEAMDETGGYG